MFFTTLSTARGRRKMLWMCSTEYDTAVRNRIELKDIMLGENGE